MSSDIQATQTDDYEVETRRSRIPDTRCQNCAGHVTLQFRRVFGDREDVVHGCHECLTNQELYSGVGAGLTEVRR
ncbi:hypothetical protein AUR64_02120 [Haloprofundus marisrubri]|uniref:Small CPxCG-related zinc finger protein n=1 Tax=Haloprofundus marisrubri TaxID=1514971 RepID=A0A0W1R378_9EURY|nr:hypothetical protein AUR64_02120 [Haloprofundus marisrubri]